MFLRKGTVVGEMQAVHVLHDFDDDTDDALGARLVLCVMQARQAAQPSHVMGAPGAPQHKDAAPMTSDEREAHRRQVAQEHNAMLGTCSDDELREKLFKDGKAVEGLKGVDAEGTPWVERAMEMLRRRRKAFAKDPKNPPVTHRFDVEIDILATLRP